jgi:hypothetical protein
MKNTTPETDATTNAPRKLAADDERWELTFERLLQFKAKFGHVNVKRAFNDGKKPHLGTWVQTQRTLYKSANLRQERIDALEAIGFRWRLNNMEIKNQMMVDEAAWNKVFDRLVKYKQQFGHTNVPSTYNDGRRTPHLGPWVSKLRANYKVFAKTNGNTAKISEHRINQLNSLGFEWEEANQVQLDKQWMRNFNYLKALKQKFGTTKLPLIAPTHTHPIASIARWSERQRHAYRDLMNNKTSHLTPERVTALESIQFSWSFQNKTKHEEWLDNYFKLFYHHLHYNTTVLTNSEACNSKFVDWVSGQKLLYHANELDQLKVSLLNELNFDWELNTEPSWNDYYAELREYHNKYHSSLINNRINKNLADWCKVQRKLFKRNILEMDKIAKLNMLDFDWDPDDIEWNAMYCRLLAYERKFGDVLVPSSYIEDPPLARWVRYQRNAYSKLLAKFDCIDTASITIIAETMATRKIPAGIHKARLENLQEKGFIWDSNEASWFEKFQRLLEFKQHNDSTLVPQKYQKDPSLGQWVTQQRHLRTQNQLEQKRIDILDEVGFEWNPLETRWNKMFERLCKYKLKNGDTNVPARGHEKADLELFRWGYQQRNHYREKRLSKERVLKLESIGFKLLTNRT